MKVYFITRFSIYDPQFGGFRISKDYDQKEYEKRLFAKDRLNSKFDTFENITIPSILKQSCKNWKWLIYTSDRLPDEYMKRLRMLVKDYINIELITVKDFRDFFEKDLSYDYGSSFATVRIDDDDGLNNFYVDKLQQYSKNIGSIISFTEGVLVKRVKECLVKGEKVSEKNIALGMAGIGIKIYNLGSHTTINEKYNVIYDSTPNMFYLNCSPFTDTNRGFTALDRNFGKFKRLIFLIFNHPREVPGVCIEFLRKRLQH
jgi:hypothetical protein